MENNIINYDNEFIYFLYSYLKNLDNKKLSELYKITHQIDLEDVLSEDILLDLLDYLEIVSLILMKEFGNENSSKIDFNYASIGLFGLNITEMSDILYIRFKDQEKVDNFTKKLRKYIKPSGIKSVSDILRD